MKEIRYEQLNETLYSEILPNGLKVFVLPKNEFHKTYGLFSTNYGSIDNEFGYVGEAISRVPDGIAHFLEHKLFEKEAGDVFQVFGQNGASANAFTSFTRTSYLFSATEHVQKNLVTLLDFVQDPYFTPETVEKEKGIIGQEIQMYQDDPDWRLFFGLLQNMYPKHPLHIDIAGSIDSIAKITADDLYHCYNTFYHPSNMTLFVVGNVDPEEVLTWVVANQAAKSFAPIRTIKRQFPTEKWSDIKKVDRLKMAVERPKAVVGIKGDQADLPTDDRQRLRFRTAVTLLLQLLLGNTSQNYLRLYNEGVLDDSFGYEFSLDRSFHFADFSGDTDDPDRFAQAIEKVVLDFANDPGINEEALALLQKKMLGKYLQSLNSLEYIANQFTQDLFGKWTLFDLPDIIQAITLDDVLQAGQKLIKKAAFSRFFVEPYEKTRP